MNQEREILKLTRLSNGKVCIYEDGKPMGVYDITGKSPLYMVIKLWRHFNHILELREKMIN